MQRLQRETNLFSHRCTCCILILFGALAVFSNLAANSHLQAADKNLTKSNSDWPQFLGPNRNGISTETGLIDSLSNDGPKEVWRIKGGAGMSGLAISDNLLATMVQNAGKQSLLIVDAKSGATLKQVTIAPSYSNAMGNGPRATPAIVGAMAYTFTGEGILAAVDLKKEAIVWNHDVLDDLAGDTAEYGMACSPLIIDDLVVVTAGATGGTVAAYDRNTGKRAWKAIAGGGDDTAGYSSPALLNVVGKEQLVVFEGKAAIGLAPNTGEQLWRYPYITDYDCNIATPIAYDGNVFISSGENHGSAMLSFTQSGKSFQVRPLWTSHGPASVMRNEWQTSILLDGHLYGMDNIGGAGPITNLNCVNAKTGKLVWQEKRFGKGNLIAAEGKLWISTMKGELVIVRATPDKFEELGRKTLIGPTRQAPALAGGYLYLRDSKEIVCLDVRKSK